MEFFISKLWNQYVSWFQSQPLKVQDLLFWIVQPMLLTPFIFLTDWITSEIAFRFKYRFYYKPQHEREERIARRKIPDDRPPQDDLAVIEAELGYWYCYRDHKFYPLGKGGGT